MDYIFKAERRSQKRVRNISRKSIAQNFIPAVVYNKDENIPITVNRHDFEKAVPHLRSNTVFKLQLEDQEISVFVRDYIHDVKLQRIEHLDFYKFQAKRPITLKIPVELIGLAKGLTKGGLIRRHSTTLKVKTMPEAIPENIEIDISDLDINDAIFVRDLVKLESIAQASYTMLSSPDQAIVSITVSSRAASGASQTKETGEAAPAADASAAAAEPSK